MVAKYHAMTILTSRMHRNNKKLPRSFIKSLLIDLKAAHKFSSILLSQFHSNETQVHAILLLFLIPCAVLGVSLCLLLYKRQTQTSTIPSEGLIHLSYHCCCILRLRTHKGLPILLCAIQAE